MIQPSIVYVGNLHGTYGKMYNKESHTHTHTSEQDLYICRSGCRIAVTLATTNHTNHFSVNIYALSGSRQKAHHMNFSCSAFFFLLLFVSRLLASGIPGPHNTSTIYESEKSTLTPNMHQSSLITRIIYAVFFQGIFYVLLFFRVFLSKETQAQKEKAECLNCRYMLMLCQRHTKSFMRSLSTVMPVAYIYSVCRTNTAYSHQEQSK